MISNWKSTERGLNRKLKFQSFTALTKFLLEVAKTADEMDHHPDLEVSKAVMLDVNLLSHDKNAVTERDHRLAEEMDRIYLSFESM